MYPLRCAKRHAPHRQIGTLSRKQFIELPDKKGHGPEAPGHGKEGRVVELLKFSARASFRARAVSVLS